MNEPAFPSALTTMTPPGQAALDVAKAYARQSLSEATQVAYTADWAAFGVWCLAEGFHDLPADPRTVAAYLASLATTHAPNTIRRRLVAIGQAHRLAGHDWVVMPVVRATLKGILRQHGRPPRQATAIGTVEIRKLIAACDTGLTGTRDRALLLLGYAGALRRAELVAICREHVKFTSDGLRLLIPRSKTDAEGQGAEIGIARGTRRESCPVRALEDWLRVAKRDYGPVFTKIDKWGTIETQALVPDAVRQILRKRAQQAGLIGKGGQPLSPHGLRAGFVTEAYKAGARDEQIMDHTRHKDLKTMRGYVRRAKLVMDSPVKLLGL